MLLSTALVVNNLGLFILEVIGYHACHSVVMALDCYYHLCQCILCTVRIVSHRIQFTYTSRHTYGLARVGVVGELVAFISFLSLSVGEVMELVKHAIDVVFILPKREVNATTSLSAHGHEHIHSLIDHPKFILGVGIYASISSFILGVIMLYKLITSTKKYNKQLEKLRNLQQPISKSLKSKALLISDALPVHHSLLQVLGMLIGPLAILACGILLIMLSENKHIRVIYSRLVDPIIACFLFISYLFIMFAPMWEAMHLVLQAKPNGLQSDEIETTIIKSVTGVVKIHDFHIWRLTPHQNLATVHIVFNTTENILAKYRGVTLILQAHNIGHVTIQPEFLLNSSEIQHLMGDYQNSPNESECKTIGCSDNRAIQAVARIHIEASSNKHFHRRSSMGLNVEELESSSESETTT